MVGANNLSTIPPLGDAGLQNLDWISSHVYGQAFAISIAIALTVPIGSASAAEHGLDSRKVKGVVELFTSQGCSSCPSADSILGKFSHDPSIVALSYHVDYWDYIGWEDPLGTRANTERQRAYAKALGNATIYTPQVVVNGQRDVIGSREADIGKALEKTSLSEKVSGISVSLTIDGDRLRISAKGSLPEDLPGRTPVLMLITYDESVDTPVTSGENKGMTLRDFHAVRDWRILGMWDSKTLDVDIPLSTLQDPDGRKAGCAAVLQSVTASGDPGPILAAAAIDF